MRRALLVLCILGLAGPRAEARQPVRFTDTEAAQAFEAGQYEKAVTELLRLRETNPDNLLVLRYLAMSYDRAGRIADALKTFAIGLQKAPQNVALLYHSGETLYRARYPDDARRHFRLVLQFGPDTEYAAKALTYLDVLARPPTARQAHGEPRRFSVYLELGALRDEYEFIGADGVTGTNSTAERLTEYLALEWHLLRRSDWRLSLEGAGYGAQYLDDATDRQDLWQYAAGGRLQRSGRLGSVPATGSLRGYHQWVQFADGEDYSASAVGTAAVQLDLTRNSRTRVHYRYTDDRFEEEGFDPFYSSRDAVNHAGGLQHTAFFFNRQVWLTLGAEYQWNDAAGLNFEFEGPAGEASLNIPLGLGFRLEADYEYREEEYTAFAGPVARKTTRQEWGAALSRWLGRSVLARLTYREADEDSTLPALAYDRRSYGLSVAYVY